MIADDALVDAVSIYMAFSYEDDNASLNENHTKKKSPLQGEAAARGPSGKT